MNTLHKFSMRGFSLIEMIVALTLIAIASAALGVFLKAPLEGRMQARARIEAADKAGMAAQHIERELSTALPNSVRIFTAGGREYLEFLPVIASGTYRASDTALGANQCAGGGAAGTNKLDLGNPDTCFTSLQTYPATLNMAAGNVLFIDPPANPYPLGNYRSTLSFAPNAVGVGAETRFRFVSQNFPSPGPASRQFYIVAGAVSYSCNLATGQLERFSGYGIPVAAAAPPAAATRSVVVDDVLACERFVRVQPVSNNLARAIVSGAFSIDASPAAPPLPAAARERIMVMISASVSLSP